MAKVFTNDENYENIAEAIRYMTGEDTTYTPEEMPGAIRSISGGAEIPDGAITTEKLADNAVTNAKMAEQAVNTPNLANGCVTSDKIGRFAVGVGKIDGGAVGEAQLAPAAVTKTKIKDKAVTADKLDNVLQNFLGQVSDMLDWYNQTDIITQVDEGTVTSSSVFNTWLSNTTIFDFIASGGAAGLFNVPNDTAAQLKFIGDYQVVTFAVFNKKYYRHIDSYAPTFIAGEWTLAT